MFFDTVKLLSGLQGFAVGDLFDQSVDKFYAAELTFSDCGNGCGMARRVYCRR